VVGLDHYCPALDTCIHATNRRKFVLLLIYASTFFVTVAVICYRISHTSCIVYEITHRTPKRWPFSILEVLKRDTT
jgi:hypothetical protein